MAGRSVAARAHLEVGDFWGFSNQPVQDRDEGSIGQRLVTSPIRGDGARRRDWLASITSMPFWIVPYALSKLYGWRPSWRHCSGAGAEAWARHSSCRR